MLPNDDDILALPKAYSMPSGFSVCVTDYPIETNYNAFICKYDVQLEIDNILDYSVIDIGDTKKHIYQFYMSQNIWYLDASWVESLLWGLTSSSCSLVDILFVVYLGSALNQF